MQGSNAWWSMGKHLAWWPMEGSNVWWPLEGSKLGGHWKEKNKHIFHLFSLPPQQNLLKPFFIDFKVLLHHGFIPLLYIFPSFSLTYKL
jgi:hypothetical protein